MPVVHHLILKYLIYYKQLRLGFVSVAICSFGVQVYHFISLKVIYYLYTTKATASCLFSHLLCSSYLHEYTTLIHTDHLCPPAPIKMKKKKSKLKFVLWANNSQKYATECHTTAKRQNGIYKFKRLLDTMLRAKIE